MIQPTVFAIALGLLVGMVLGQRFKVLVLLPAIALALIVTIGIGTARADTLWAIVLTLVATITSLQIGYMAGAGLAPHADGSRRRRVTALPGSLPLRRPNIESTST